MKDEKDTITARGITLPDIMGWNSISDIEKTFNVLGFTDTKVIDSKRVAVALSSSPAIILQVIETDKDPQAHLKDFNNRTRYLLLATDGYRRFTFVKQAFSAAGTPKPVKFRFSKNTSLGPVVTKLRAHLVPGNPAALDNLFDTREVVKSFYKQYKDLLCKVEQTISGIPDSRERRHYAELIMYRLMFCYFIQTRHFISDDPHYFQQMLDKNTKRNFYTDFLCNLFFNVLNTKKENRSTTDTTFHKVPFLNGGLFRRHSIEESNANIAIPNTAFAEIFAFLDRWAWYADDDEEFEVNGINPEILGHIFEQTITDRPGKGAYYTPIDVTNFITRQSIVSHCIDSVNSKFGSEYTDIPAILEKPNHASYMYFSVLCPIKVLDNACGSGEFLLSASKVLAELYNTAWSSIEQKSTPDVLAERKMIDHTGSQKHYFQRRIITNNLYGIDMEGEAIEICKLRLWLSLISGVDKNSVEPLPNIDYNIVEGNSLTGYTSFPKKYQEDLDNSNSLLEKINEFNRLKHLFNSESDPYTVKLLSGQIDSLILDANKIMNKLRINEIGLDPDVRTHNKKSTAFAPNKSFHYIMGFADVINNGGFDVIIGNPPYIEQRVLDYPTSFLKLSLCNNTYAYFFEVSLKLLKQNGRLGYIVPISSVSTKRMAPLQDMLLADCSELWISNYDDRPGKIFEGLEHCRSSVILCKSGSGNCKVHTTGYTRWYTNQRPSLFSNVCYVESSAYKTSTAMPKLANHTEVSIIDKLNTKKLLGPHIVTIETPYPVWYHNAPQYWIRGMDFLPKFLRGKKNERSTHTKAFYLKHNDTKTVTLALLNSSLFYWYFIKMSNCRDLTISDIKNFPSSIDDLSSATVSALRNLNKKLMISYQENSYMKETSRKLTGRVTNQEFRPSFSKHIIDEIDKVLAPHYKFTCDELTYIQTFDLDYRMGD